MSDTPASDPGPTGGDTPLPQVGRDGAAFWGGLLAPGETLRWHGAPDPRLFTPAGGPAILAVLAGGAGTGIVIALRAGGSAAQAVAGIGLFVSRRCSSPGAAASATAGCSTPAMR